MRALPPVMPIGRLRRVAHGSSAAAGARSSGRRMDFFLDEMTMMEIACQIRSLWPNSGPNLFIFFYSFFLFAK